MHNRYEEDFYAWTHQQHQLMKEHKFDKLDIDNLLEEIDDMGKNVHNELYSRLSVLLMHLLKWKYQPQRQCKSWKYTIKIQRKDLKKHIKKNPSLQYELNETIADAYESAIYKASAETDLDESIFPKQCEWNNEQILNDAGMDEII